MTQPTGDNPMKNPFSLEGKVAIVTGGSKGIGLSIAHHLAAMGAKVAIASRKIEACEAAAQEIRDAGGEAMAVACNISRRDECEALVAKTHEAWGRLDIFVANAAVNPVYGPLADLTDEAFNKVMTSNVHSAIWFANAAMPHMAEAGGGAFIIVSSIGGLRGSATLGAYGISKTADVGVTRSLAVEWGPKNITVNCIMPGLIKTDFARALWENDSLRDDRIARTPVRRLGAPEDIGGVATFLAGPSARFITGEVIVVDGGTTIVGP
ncbi:MAG: SDR family oxidoreductase [Sulfitobacter sp.]|uniref:SDR family NAD(P)-dependent oxidoreductase n=1 Tax=unclassified Sulfitobacter TaxID=196795 RepID=UPI000AFDEDC4|nr:MULTISPECIES: SDR family oxidoreductase [unclassified Sulfitobacter]WPZ29732.1 SDR family oxidoreductase [Sulfitobacter sp. OXR-159]